MIQVEITGRLTEEESGRPLSGLYVRAFDKDVLFDDLLGSAFSEPDGSFRIISRASDFRDFFEVNPDVYLLIYGPDGKQELHSTKDAIHWNVSASTFLDVKVPRSRLKGIVARPALKAVGDAGDLRKDLDVGESLIAAAENLRPSTPHSVTVHVEDTVLFSQVVMSDQAGVVSETVLWPQVGLDDPKSDRVFTLEEAQAHWKGKVLRIQLAEGEEALAESAIRIADAFVRPLVYSIDEEGRPRNGFVAGEHDAIVGIHNPPFSGSARVYMVARQHSWRPGDRFEPATLRSGRPAFVDVQLPEDGELSIRVARARELLPGAYDFIVRPHRYGYEDDEFRRLTANDLIGFRNISGLVVREEFMFSKFVRGGCANAQPISGRTLSGAPYFQYTNVFQLGEPVYGALDPSALDPAQEGKMVALYVVEHKSSAQWSADPSLTHLPALGGNGNVITLKAQTGCINANKRLLWAAAELGDYDIVADFGNDSTDSAAFVSDASFDQPLDMVDGYAVVGFKVIEDPATRTEFDHAGSFNYNDGSITVTDDANFYDPSIPLSAWDPSATPYTSTGIAVVNLEAKARVYFPADVADATAASQISADEISYPIFAVVHGNSGVSNSYEGYDYLLKHMAQNGFIAVSIHMPRGMKGRGRAEVLLDHLTRIKTKFGERAANQIGVFGHSRGGEAVVIAPRIAQETGSPHNIVAVASLAPTDQYGREDLVGTPLMVLYGSMDGDVSGRRLDIPGWLIEPDTVPQRTGFSIHDRASGSVKSMHFVYGATHNRFNTLWGTESGALANGSKLLDSDAHHAVVKGYVAGFMRRWIMGAVELDGLMRGEWVPTAVQLADSGKAKVYTQFQEEATNRLVVDSFEGPHTATSWKTSDIGNVEDDSTLPVDPSENALVNMDARSPHDTAGCLVQWDGTGDRLRFELGDARDLTGYDAVAVRIAQKTASTVNPTGSQDLYLGLKDQGGNERDVRVSKFVEIPESHGRANPDLTKSAMNTIRIPLHAYTIKVAGMLPVDLSHVVEATLHFGVKPAGEIEIDSFEFTS
ncbi:MAG: hypothetical protein IH878_14715 [Gemmatimonadetes bacterium]|nr:hypothetical protein [Gemmatimonadota bacterium]